MTVHDRFIAALGRIANASSVVRTRSEDATRQENHGDVSFRMESVVCRFEALADELEKDLA